MRLRRTRDVKMLTKICQGGCDNYVSEEIFGCITVKKWGIFRKIASVLGYERLEEKMGDTE